MRLEAAKVLFDLLTAAVRKESAGLGSRRAGAIAAGVVGGPTWEARAFELFPVKGRSGRAASGQHGDGEYSEKLK